MKKILLGTTLLFGLGGPAFADPVNTIAIDDGSGSVGSLAITQDSTNGGNTVSADGSTGSDSSSHKLAITGPWTSIAITQTGAGNTLQGTTIHSTSAGTLAVNQFTTGTGTNTHTLNIGSSGTPPTSPTVTVYVKNVNADGSTPGTDNNTIADTLNGASLSYNLGLKGENNTLTNSVSAGAGGITLAYGNGAYGVSSNKGIAGSDNIIHNTLISSGGTVNASLQMNGTNNGLTNAVTTSGGNITLTQGGSGNGIIGDNNTIDNEIGQGASNAVASFAQTLLVSGGANTITNTVTSDGAKVVNQSVTGDSNTIVTNVSGGGAQTANVSISGSYVDYAITTAGNGSYANVSLTGVGGTGTGASADIVRVQQTSAASGATVMLTVAGGGHTMGNLLSVPGTYSTDTTLAGVAVYQASAGAYLNTSVTGAANGYTAKFAQ